MTRHKNEIVIKHAEIPDDLSQIRGDRHSNAYPLKQSDRPLFYYRHFHSSWFSSLLSFFYVVDLAVSAARIVVDKQTFLSHSA